MKPEDIIGAVNAPSFISKIGNGAAGINRVLNVGVTLLYSVAAVAVVYMLVIAAFNLVISGGDKEKLAGARSRITYALIGILLLAVAFVVLKALGDILGFALFTV